MSIGAVGSVLNTPVTALAAAAVTTAALVVCATEGAVILCRAEGSRRPIDLVRRALLQQLALLPRYEELDCEHAVLSFYQPPSAELLDRCAALR